MSKRELVLILVALFLLASTPVAVYLVTRKPGEFEVRKKAAPSGTVIENDKFKVTVIDVGPGNYDSQVCVWPEGGSDARAVSGSTLTQLYSLENKTTANYKLTLISYPYKIYAIFNPGNGGCIDAYTDAEINYFVEQNGGDSDKAYRVFAEKLLTSIRKVTEKCGAHVYDNGPFPPYDPSTGQDRITTSPGGLSCSQLGGLVPEGTYSDAQTHIGTNYISAGSITLDPGESLTNQSFAFQQSVCGFYQWDHGFLYENLDNPDETPQVMWVGSELKFFPCPPSPCRHQLCLKAEECEFWCTELIAYDTSWRKLTTLTDLDVQNIRFVVKGKVKEGCPDLNQGRFRFKKEGDSMGDWRYSSTSPPSGVNSECDSDGYQCFYWEIPADEFDAGDCYNAEAEVCIGDDCR